MKRKLCMVFAITLLLAAVSVPFLLAYRYRHAADAYRESLRAAGQFRTLAEARPVPRTNVHNGGPALTNLMARLPSLPPELTFGTVQGLPAGKRCVVWAEASFPTPAVTNLWPPLRAFLATNAANLAAVRAACNAPVIEFAFSYEQGLKEPPWHACRAKPITHLLAADARLRLHDGQPETALADARAGVRFAARWNREPLPMSQYARIGMAAVLVDVSWDLLQFRGWTDADLAGLQSDWQELDLPAGADGWIEMQQAYAVMVSREFSRSDFLALEQGPGRPGGHSFAELIHMSIHKPDDAATEVADRHVCWWAFQGWRRYRLELANLEQAQVLRAAVRRARTHGAWRREYTRADCEATRQLGNLWGIPSFVPLGTFCWTSLIAKYGSIQTQREMLLTAIALERFRLCHGDYPDRLEQLTPLLLPTTPRDFIVGEPLHYRRGAAGEFTLYGVGEDEFDNGGDPRPAKASPNWTLGKDMVWPKAASAGETAAALEPVRKTGPSYPYAPMSPELQEKFRRRYGVSAAPPPPVPASKNSVE